MAEMADLFDVLRASLFTDEDVSLSDWEPVFEEMVLQTVAALPGEWLASHLDAEPWRLYCRMEQAEWTRVMHAQDGLLRLLEAHGIPCVILKGAAAAMAYPHPTLRSMGDVDCLVKRADFERTAALLEANGYAEKCDKELATQHYSYTRDGVTVELHRRTPLVAETDEERLALFEAGIDAREWHETEGHRFPTLPPALNGLVLLLHINHHLRSGLGLRQIVDWMMYVHALPTNTRSELRALLEDAGQTRLAQTVTLLCQRYLGLEAVVGEDDSLPVDGLLAHILEKGNFGQKIGIDGKIAEVGLVSTEPGGFFRRLQDGGMTRWSAARKHAALRPFAWLYQAFRIAGILLKTKKSPREILSQRRHGAEQRRLIDALGLELNGTIRRR